jgi:hypothetical protein
MPTILDVNDANAWEWRIGHDGRRVKVLAAGVDGVRVRAMVRDSASVAGQIARDRMQVTDASGDSGLGLHKPGARFASDRAAYDAAEQAYLERVRDGESAWKQLDASPPPGAYPYEAHKEGTACTINGAPGVLQREGDHLICREQRRDSTFTSDAQADAYRERCERGEQAWRNLGSA